MAKPKSNNKNNNFGKGGQKNITPGVLPPAGKFSIASVEGFSNERKGVGLFSFPSRLIYSVDVPEIKNFVTEFRYNYYVANESVKDRDILVDDEIRRKMNISMDINFKKSYDYTDDTWLFIDNNTQISLEKLPRYVKLQWNTPNSEKAQLANGVPNLIEANNNNIVKEETFSSNYYTSLYFNNADLIAKTSVFSEGNSNNSYYKQIDTIGEANTEIAEALASKDVTTNGATFFRVGKGAIKGNDYLESLKKLSTSTQISNNVIYDLIVNSSGNPLTLNEKSFKELLQDSSILQGNSTDTSITDQEFKTSVSYYSAVSGEYARYTDPEKYEIVGYIIDKLEIFSDGSRKNHDSIIIENPRTNSAIDLEVRYGTVYAYSIRTVMSVTYPAINNQTHDFMMIKSLIASKPTIAFAETLENIGPPPPVELKATWDYDRINPATMLLDPTTNTLYPNTGTRGSLLLHWSFPINSQMDIKKFQLFRRKNINEPFELIKVYDFNDAIIKFPDLEESINPSLVEFTLPEPKKSFYDDEFYKNSEFIYAVAAIDAHGFTSNYSEQLKVSFDVYKNKLMTTVISSAGAPKQYPNLYLREDLFVDTIRTSNKKTLNVYFTPDCYSAKDNASKITKIVKNANNERTHYKINFINLDNQDSSQLKIEIKGATSHAVRESVKDKINSTFTQKSKLIKFT